MKVIVDNLAVAYHDHGKGRVMLMLHGWKDAGRSFDRLASQISGSYRFIQLDLPGFGDSELPRTPWTLADYVEFVEHFVEKLHLQVDVLVGHSMGGRIAIKGVASGSLHAHKLVLIGSAGIAKSNSLRNRMYKIVAKTGKAATLVPPLSLARTRLRRRLYQQAGSDYLTAGPLTQTFLSIIAEDLQAQARQIKIPTLLVWGSEDDQTPLSDGQALARLIPTSKLYVVNGAGHFVHLTHDPEVADRMKDFLA